MEIVSRECLLCHEVKSLDEFNKGNGKYGKRSYCSKCQYLKHKEYKQKLSYDKRKEIYQNRKNKVKEWCSNNKERLRKAKKLYYLSNKKHLDLKKAEWRNNNKEKYKAIRKASKARRRCFELSAGPLQTSSVMSLQEYNKKYFLSDNFKCEYCSSIITGTYELEHIVPISKGGTNDISNLAISCSKCNHSKFVKSLEEFMPELVNYFRDRKL